MILLLPASGETHDTKLPKPRGGMEGIAFGCLTALFGFGLVTPLLRIGQYSYEVYLTHMFVA
jgi:hypothetical protein